MTGVAVGMVGAGAVATRHVRTLQAMDGVRVVAVADPAVERAHALAELEPDPRRSMAEAAQLLERLAERVGRAWASLP